MLLQSRPKEAFFSFEGYLNTVIFVRKFKTTEGRLRKKMEAMVIARKNCVGVTNICVVYLGGSRIFFSNGIDEGVFKIFAHHMKLYPPPRPAPHLVINNAPLNSRKEPIYGERNLHAIE